MSRLEVLEVLQKSGRWCEDLEKDIRDIRKGRRILWLHKLPSTHGSTMRPCDQPTNSTNLEVLDKGWEVVESRGRVTLLLLLLLFKFRCPMDVLDGVGLVVLDGVSLPMPAEWALEEECSAVPPPPPPPPLA